MSLRRYLKLVNKLSVRGRQQHIFELQLHALDRVSRLIWYLQVVYFPTTEVHALKKTGALFG